MFGRVPYNGATMAIATALSTLARSPMVAPDQRIKARTRLDFSNQKLTIGNLPAAGSSLAGGGGAG